MHWRPWNHRGLPLTLSALALVGMGLAWRQWGAHASLYLRNRRVRATLPATSPKEWGRRLLVVAPHPDDETLGCCGVILQALGNGAFVHVALVTNGDGYQHQRFGMLVEDAVLGTAREHLRIGRRRQSESRRALADMGLRADCVTFLGYPDGGIHAMWQPAHWSLEQPFRSPRTRTDRNPYPDSFSSRAPYAGAQLLADLHRILRQTRPDVVLTTAPFDVHRDHWATHGFVRLAVEAYSQEIRHAVPVRTFLIHRHDWPAPQGRHPDEMLVPPAAWVLLPGLTWSRVDLTRPEIAVKERCLAEYRSQDAAHLAELQSFLRADELFCYLEEPLPRPVLSDPVGDLPPDRERPAGDIAEVEIAREGNGCVATVTLARKPARDVTYAIVCHEVGRGTVESVVWSGGTARLLRAAPTGRMTVERVRSIPGRNALVAALPPGVLTHGEFLLEAYSQQKGQYLNHTLTALARIDVCGAVGAARAEVAGP